MESTYTGGALPVPNRDTEINPKTQEEREWLLAAQKDPSAFEPIFHRYHDPIFNYALLLSCSVSLAQDITATTFLKALNNIPKFQWQGISLSSWLYRIAIYEINQNYRKHKRTVPLTSELTKTLRDENKPDSALLELEESIAKNKKFKRACSALTKLKVKYQTVLTLRYFEEKSIKEIAEILDLSENTVKTHTRRGLIELRKLL
jgi:RNA polymerase sigma-70 factor (ECF subfamily)